jgi:hypothetical protein
MLQCLNIYKTAVVQKRRIDTHSEIGAPGYVNCVRCRPTLVPPLLLAVW